MRKYSAELKIQICEAELSEQERFVFFNRARGEMSLDEMAAELGMSYKAVTAVYYRTVRKLKIKMQGGSK